MARRPETPAELRYWLRSMLWDHGFSDEEIGAATDLTPDEIARARQRFGIHPDMRPEAATGGRLKVLPYPGGRHPRIGFLDGAVDPQRETKISVFTPWDPTSYVVVDLPEAIWSNLGLTYLAHTHIPTIWDAQGIALEPQEWRRRPGGILERERTLPNGIRFTARVTPSAREVRMSLRLYNGTAETLTDLRVQICVMLARASGFEVQTNDNKRFAPPYIACRDVSGSRWIITAWECCHRTWANPPCPCMHSDPRFPDLAAGEEAVLRGSLSFYEGTDIEAELARLERRGWGGPSA
jgi:hypothetical protein